MSKLKMLEPITKKYKITLLTGLHIGTGDGGLKIGGIDSQVVKNPISGEPYIPGSSIKGKARAILEMITGDYSDNFGPSENIEGIIARAFGTSFTKIVNNKKEQVNIASRLIFSDFNLTQEYKDKFKELGPDFFEDKSENSVPRFLKGQAMPRLIERVPAGVEFEGTITLIPVEGKNGISKEELEDILKDVEKYLNAFGLGGGVSRGNGRIKMEFLEEIKN